MKLERDSVHAVSLAPRGWAVGKHMSEMSTAIRAMNFRSSHEEAAIDGRCHGGGERLREARPSRTALEFGV